MVKGNYPVFTSNSNLVEKLSYLNISKADIKKLNPGELPTEKPFLMVIEFKENLSIFFKALEKRVWNVPVFVLDSEFDTSHSQESWMYKQVIGYLVWNDREKENTLKEIKDFLTNRIRQQEEVKQVESQEIGSYVKIEEGEFAKQNLVSLFVGEMRKKMVELKLLCETAKPVGALGQNYFRGFKDVMKLLDWKRAKRLGEKEFKHLGKNYKLQDYENEIDKKDAEEFFDGVPRTKNQGVILVRGNTGTGKSIIAKFIHEYIYQSLSDHGEIITVSCTNIGEHLFESQLFGCLEGAFTDAVPQPGAILQAYNGTLFLDEIGDLSLYHQGRLLQYLQDGMVSPMGWVGKPIFVPSVIIAATNRKLEEMVKEGQFREDLFHRLGVYVILPGLKERRSDIDRLVDFVLQNPRVNPGRTIKKVDKRILEYLKDPSHEYKGNFRELEDKLRWAVVQARKDESDILTLEHVKHAFEQYPVVIREE